MKSEGGRGRRDERQGQYLHVFKHPTCSIALNVVPKAVRSLECPPRVEQLSHSFFNERHVQGTC